MVRKRLLKKVTVVLLLTLVVFIGVQCAPTPVPEATPTPGPPTATPIPPTPTVAPEKETIIFAVKGDLENIDATFTGANETSQTVCEQIYEKPFHHKVVQADGYKAVTPELAPATFESYDISPDGKTITLHIGEGRRFADGTPVTAEAVRFTWQRCFETKGIGQFYLSMGGVESIDDIEVIDDKTLALHLSKPNRFILQTMSVQNTAPVNPKAIKEHATDDDPWAIEWLKTHGAGSGPWVLESWTPGTEMVLTPNEYYWQGPSKLKKVIMRVVPEAADRVLLLKSGAIDMALDIPSDDLVEFEKDPNVKVISVTRSRFQLWLGMNCQMPPFDNQKVRQAINYAIPYDTILEEVYRGYAEPFRSPIPAGMPTHTDEFWHYETDLEKAKELLAEAGYPDGFKSTLTIIQGMEEHEAMAVWIRDNLKKIGVDLEIEILTPTAFVTEMRKRSRPMHISFFHMWINDPYYSLFWTHRSDSDYNYAAYENEEVDRLLSTYMLSDDLEARDEASRRMQQLIVEEASWAYLATPNYNIAMRADVEEWFYNYNRLVWFWPMYKR